MKSDDLASRKAGTGVAGLDDLLDGGLARRRVYLLECSPGTGKTTIALQFLRDGSATGEKGLYITLSETEEELRDSAASHGWRLDDSIDVSLRHHCISDDRGHKPPARNRSEGAVEQGAIYCRLRTAGPALRNPSRRS